MEKQIMQSTYWAGLVCAVGAFVWRGLSMVSMLPSGVGPHGKEMGALSLYKAALLLLLLAIATAGSAGSAEHK